MLRPETRHALRIQMRTRFAELLLFVLLWGSFAYFHHSRPGWNVNSRLALTYAVMERGTFQIGDYWKRPDLETDDVAVFRGRVYSDKIIGVSLLGLPAFAGVRMAELARGRAFSDPLRRYLVTLFSVGILASMSGVLLLRLMLLLTPGLSLGAALILCAGTFLGSQLFFYSTLYMAYLPAQFFILAGLYLFERWRALAAAAQTSVPAPPLLVCGLLLGCGILCEYTVGIIAGTLSVYMSLSIPRRRDAWKLASGVLLALAPFFLYTLAIFRTFAIPYRYEHNRLFQSYMSRGFLGATTPNARVLALITVHPYRGLFFHSPFLLMAFPGLIRMWRRDEARGLAAAAAFAFAAFLVFNSAYYMWWGGWSFGPRILVPAIPLLAIPLAYALNAAASRLTILAGFCWAVPLHLVVNAVDPQFRDLNARVNLRMLLEPSFGREYPWIFTQYIWPLFRAGQTDLNAGTLLFGLSGPNSLLPLALFWAGGAAALWALTRPER